MIMALNKNILMKLNEKTKKDDKQRDFLLKIFKYEFSSKTSKKGWYKSKYEDFMKETMGDEQHEN